MKHFTIILTESELKTLEKLLQGEINDPLHIESPEELLEDEPDFDEVNRAYGLYVANLDLIQTKAMRAGLGIEATVRNGKVMYQQREG